MVARTQLSTHENIPEQHIRKANKVPALLILRCLIIFSNSSTDIISVLIMSSTPS
jgi:hypothetical protein